MAQQDKRTKKWTARWYENGRRKSKSGFSSKRNADLYEAQRKTKKEYAYLGIHIDEQKIDEIIEKYLAWTEKNNKKNSYKRDKTCLKSWQIFFQEKAIRFVRELSKEHMVQFIDWRKKMITRLGKEPSNRTVNLEVSTLRHIFKWAYRFGILKNLIMQEPPLLKQQRQGVPKYLTKEEIEKIEQVAKETNRKIYEAIAVLARTGLRSSELCNLELKNIDLEKQTITLNPAENKTGLIRIIPLFGKALEIIYQLYQEAQENKREYLFTKRNNKKQDKHNLLRRFQNILKKTEGIDLEGINIHTLRKTYISHAVMSGMDHIKIMAIVGHKDFSTIKHYLVLSKEYVGSERDFLPY